MNTARNRVIMGFVSPGSRLWSSPRSEELASSGVKPVSGSAAFTSGLCCKCDGVIVELDVLQLSWSGNDRYDAATDGVRSILDSKGSRSSVFCGLDRLFRLLDLDMLPTSGNLSRSPWSIPKNRHSISFTTKDIQRGIWLTGPRGFWKI